MFTRLLPLIQEEGLNTLQNSTVMVVGCGGVGSFAVEALARSGVGRLIIIDKDAVDITNLNRQLIALHSTIDQYKVDILEARIKDINPACEVIKFAEFYTLENKEKFWAYKIDFVIDAIDTVTFKIDIIKTALAKDIKFISVVGQGNRMRPEMIDIRDITKTEYDPLAKAIRVKLRKDRVKGKVPVVFNKEIPFKAKDGSRRPASNAFVPAAAGLTAASYAVRTLIEV